MAKPDAALVERVSKAKKKASGITQFKPPAGYEQSGNPEITMRTETHFYPKEIHSAPESPSLRRVVRRIAIAEGREAR